MIVDKTLDNDYNSKVSTPVRFKVGLPVGPDGQPGRAEGGREGGPRTPGPRAGMIAFDLETAG